MPDDYWGCIFTPAPVEFCHGKVKIVSCNSRRQYVMSWAGIAEKGPKMTTPSSAEHLFEGQ